MDLTYQADAPTFSVDKAVAAASLPLPDALRGNCSRARIRWTWPTALREPETPARSRLLRCTSTRAHPPHDLRRRRRDRRDDGGSPPPSGTCGKPAPTGLTDVVACRFGA